VAPDACIGGGSAGQEPAGGPATRGRGKAAGSGVAMAALRRSGHYSTVEIQQRDQAAPEAHHDVET